MTYSIAGQYVETLVLTGYDAINATGNNQANALHGNDAANVIKAEGGNDRLRGGGGSDTLTGGTGLDTFVFDTDLDASGNVDGVLDFSSADDTIELSGTVFAAIGIGTLAAAAFRIGAVAADADDRIVYNQGSGQIYYDADGSGIGAAVLFASLSANTTLIAADVVVT